MRSCSNISMQLDQGPQLNNKGDGDTCRQLETGCDEEAAEGVHFFPPLYTQRYSLAAAFLMEHGITSVIDFGCAECGFMQLLPTVPSLEQIALVDIDRGLLESKKHAIKPELRHYVLRRSKPLHVSLMAGSAEDTDSRLLNYEAVTMIEVVEHLYPDVLEKVVQNVFGSLKPKMCILTTPNADFNVLFNNHDPQQFRHWDHKFEWTRQEFAQWCDNICESYGYSVHYSGVGRMSSRPDTDHLGPCSQAAVFRLQEEGRLSQSCQLGSQSCQLGSQSCQLGSQSCQMGSQSCQLGSQSCQMGSQSCQLGSQCYELIAESDFPHERDVLLLEEKIDMEVSYCLRQMVVSQKSELTPGQPVMVPVSRLAGLYTVRALCGESGVRESLQRIGQRFSSDGLFVVQDDVDEADEGWFDDTDEDNESDRLDALSGGELREEECELNRGEHQAGNTGGSSPRSTDLVVEENWDTDHD